MRNIIQDNQKFKDLNEIFCNTLFFNRLDSVRVTKWAFLLSMLLYKKPSLLAVYVAIKQKISHVVYSIIGYDSLMLNKNHKHSINPI